MTRKNGHKNKVITTNTEGVREREHVTTRGVTIWIRSMPPMLPELLNSAIRSEWEEMGKVLPTKPTYEVEVAGGGKETHEHDEKSVKETPGAEVVWEAWEKAELEFSNAVNNALFEELVRNSIRFEIDPSWPKRFKRLRPPADPIEAQDFYARATVIGGREDVEAIMRIASELTGVDARLQSAAEDSFPDNVEERDSAPAVEDARG